LQTPAFPLGYPAEQFLYFNLKT